MRAMLIGNGYDLNLNLPTRYIDFLCTGDFLLKNRGRKYKTISEVFSDVHFAKNRGILNSYTLYQYAYEQTPINQDDIIKIVDALDGNGWFKYFQSSFNEELGWIDFEKEIRNVLARFDFIFRSDIHFNGYTFYMDNLPLDIIFTVNYFNVFARYDGIARQASINPDFILESPKNSGNHILDKQKIATSLLESIRKLSEALALYMKCFVDKIISKIDTSNLDYKAYTADAAISLNYTHTYEILNNIQSANYFHDMRSTPCAFHIHGETDKKIILGINTDQTDSVEYADPIFAPFKKYFQRVLYGTDEAYIEFIKFLQMYADDKFHLSVVGHSLDITDKDIIIELFDVADTITIYYHSGKSKASMIKNIISIFGMETFHKYRFEKDLMFIDMNDNETKVVAHLVEDFS